MTADPLDLDGLAAKLAAATPGPWWNESGTVHAPYPFGRNDGLPGAACHPLDAQGGNGLDADADAELAAATVNALPELLRLARRGVELEAAVLALAEELENRPETLDRIGEPADYEDGLDDGAEIGYEGAARLLRRALDGGSR